MSRYGHLSLKQQFPDNNSSYPYAISVFLSYQKPEWFK